MKDLLSYILQNISGEDGFTIEESEEDGKILLEVKAKPEVIGLIIGKQGKTIKNIRRILAVRAAREKTAVNIAVNEA